MLFLGEYYVSFSGQGRLVVPKKIRELLGQAKGFTLTKGFDDCLAGYKDDDWKKGTAELMSVSVTDNQKNEFKRHFFSSAVTIEIDRQGRIVIPQSLLDYVGFQSLKEAVIIGVGDHFEIWEPRRWQDYLKTIKNKINRSNKEK